MDKKRVYPSGYKKRQKKIKASSSTKPIYSYYNEENADDSDNNERSGSNNSDNNENECENENSEFSDIDEYSNYYDEYTDTDYGDESTAAENSNDDDTVTRGDLRSDDVDMISDNVSFPNMNIGDAEGASSDEYGNHLDLTNDFPTDRGHFTGVVTPELRREILEHGPCRPTDQSLFLNAEGKKNFTTSLYKNRIDNFETPRQWLCYSPALQRPYCEVCWLFADREKLHSEAWIKGVEGGLNNMGTKIKKHEKSKSHINASCVYGRWKSGKTIDVDAEKQTKLDILFWTRVLKRILSIILTLSTLNLALRGHRETVHDGVCEGGNFLGIVALMAQYDSVLKEVISLPKRATKYLSNNIQEELIGLIGKALKQSLVNKINRSPFWSIILDTTSDLTRVDQLSVIIRWVNINDIKCEPVESFLGFVEVTDADAQGLVDTTKTFLLGIGIDMKKIRGQGYDGANVMSGVRGGVQKLIKDICSSPVPFVHCASHNLNLVINDAVKNLPQNETFFSTLQDIFNFFGKSLNRWRQLQISGDHSSLTLKKLCATRWVSRLQSVRAVRDRYAHILKILTHLSLTSDNNTEKNTAIGLRQKMESFEFIVFLVLWERILRAFFSTSNELQSKKMELSRASRLLKSTESELLHIRDNFDSVVESATAIANSWNVEPSFKKCRRYFFSSQKFMNDFKDPVYFFKVNIFNRTLDVAMKELRDRFHGQNLVTDMFAFLYPQNLTKISPSEIKEAVNKLVKSFSHDFLEEDLRFEIRSFADQFKPEISSKTTVSGLLDIMNDFHINSSFPQLQKVCVLFLTIPVTVASAERSFSKLKLIKTYLRSKMSQDRLSNLALISIENEEAKSIDMSELIRKFAAVNSVRSSRFF